MAERIRIDLLADHPEAIPLLKEWFESEWASHYGPEGLGDARSDLTDSCNYDQLTIALVAIEDGNVCGTASLRMESVPTHKELYPWLAALLVGTAYRGRGIAKILITAIEEKARQSGYDYIYAGTSRPDSPLFVTVWETIGKGDCYDGSVTVIRKALSKIIPSNS